MTAHEQYINRCIQLAKNGLGRTYPNPIVGSVIVYKDRIIGEGWHHKAGEAHAEVNAVASVKDRSLLPKSTIYVSLEPCSHYGKTPPCSNLIIDSGIKRVIIGTVDPFSKVAGKGIKKLLDAGCEVRVGVLEKECRELNRRFFTFHTKQRPYIILKWAQSADAFLAPLPQKDAERKPVWITNKYSRQLVHKWRAEEQAIMVGTNTAVADNPKLNTRRWKGQDAVRVVLDRKQRIPADSHLFDNSVKTIILTENPSAERAAENVIFEQVDFSKELPQQICEVLYRHEIQSVIIEGGRQTLQTFLDAGLWDETRVFEGSTRFNEGIKAPEISGEVIYDSEITGDRIKIYRND
ncbi:bifunctional diaminohydroxyphosphoribosylaminopyrimidine deaminase/5-amino-6-(5-phosphoribosylamino)uracil reductase RibD [Salinimicrobium sp. CDJ15-81-2]|nr:bifunctional diaminohydroxyphosphoribosylaminopyrimidine deaminase/5-amino-6-(5-phosphoribosylamino)uracil reductase RibD [Salinimicrobium nanhaiense]